MKTGIIIVAVAAIVCGTAVGLFVPGHSEENKLVRAFLNNGVIPSTLPPENRYTADDVEAVDLIVSRSSDSNQVVYGRYRFNVSSTGGILVHDDQQATCGTDEHSYFVLGLNDDGLGLIRSWMNGANETFELSLRAQTMRQISQSSDDSFISSRFHIGANIEALVLHLRVSNPFPKDLFPEITGKRRRRRSWTPGAGDCQRKRYTVDFKNNLNIISPKIVDIGICEGSCIAAHLPGPAHELNSTLHTMKMVWNVYSNTRMANNPEPKACCYPYVYDKFYFVTKDRLQNLYVEFVEGMIAKACSCK